MNATFMTGVGVGVTATAAVLIPLLSATVPGQTGWELAQAKDRIATLEKQVQEQTAAKDAASREAREYNEKLAATNEKLNLSLSENLFNAGSAYLKNFGAVHLGDRAEALLTAYPGAEVEQDDANGRWTLKIDHPVFKSIIFGFTPGDKRRKIDHMILTPDYVSVYKDTEVMHRELLQSLGQRGESPKDGYFRWKLGDGIGAFLTPFHVSVIAGDKVPGLWPDPTR